MNWLAVAAGLVGLVAGACVGAGTMAIVAAGDLGRAYRRGYAAGRDQLRGVR